MKISLRHLAGAASCALALTHAVAADGPTTRRGPDTLHYTVRNNVAPMENGPASIQGTFQLQYVGRGESSRQTMTLRISGLETSATNSLTAGIGDDPANVHTVALFSTDRRGRVNSTMTTRIPAPARPGRIPPLPEMLVPLTSVGAICVEDSNGQLIANGGVFDAYKYQYLVKRNLTTEDAESTATGWMTLTANQRRATLTLAAGGLDPSTTYSLVLNSEVVGTVTTNARGYFKLKGWPEGAPPVLQLRSLSISTEGGEPILTTSLPR
jgi:hypothetical protein